MFYLAQYIPNISTCDEYKQSTCDERFYTCFHAKACDPVCVLYHTAPRPTPALHRTTACSAVVPDRLLAPLGTRNSTEGSAPLECRRVHLAPSTAQEACASAVPRSPPALWPCVSAFQGHGVQPEEHFPLPVASSGFPVLIAASE